MGTPATDDACCLSYADAMVSFEHRLLRAEMRAFNFEHINHALRAENASLQRHKESNRRDKRRIASMNTRIETYRQEIRKGYAYKAQKNNVQKVNARMSKEIADLKRRNKQQERSLDMMRACCEEYQKQALKATEKCEAVMLQAKMSKKLVKVVKYAKDKHIEMSTRMAKLEKKCEVQQKLIKSLIEIVKSRPKQPCV